MLCVVSGYGTWFSRNFAQVNTPPKIPGVPCLGQWKTASPHEGGCTVRSRWKPDHFRRAADVLYEEASLMNRPHWQQNPAHFISVGCAYGLTSWAPDILISWTTVEFEKRLISRESSIWRIRRITVISQDFLCWEIGLTEIQNRPHWSASMKTNWTLPTAFSLPLNRNT
jgi:hypothetical protein